MKNRIPKPFSEMTKAEKINEAQGAIRRLQETMNTGDNRFGEYGRNCRDAIARWQKTLTELTEKGQSK